MAQDVGGGDAFVSHDFWMSVADSAAAKIEGKRLEQYGIQLLPYVPDPNHTFVDDLIKYIDARRGRSDVLQERFKLARSALASGRFVEAALVLYHVSHAAIKSRADRRALGDTMSDFFSTALAHADAKAFAERCQQLKVDLSLLWSRYADFVLLVPKTIHGLTRALNLLEAATGTNYPLLAIRL